MRTAKTERLFCVAKKSVRTLHCAQLTPIFPRGRRLLWTHITVVAVKKAAKAQTNKEG